MPDTNRTWLWVSPAALDVHPVRPLGTVVHQYRTAAGLTQEDVARLLHLDQSYVSKIESGQRSVRDVGLLALMSTRLNIPAMELGLSDERVWVAGNQAASSSRAAEAAPRHTSLIAASQEEWRTVRRYLNRHRSDLAREAVELYPDSMRLGPTTLISLPAWLPATPVELSRIALEWRAGAAPLKVHGGEPEALRVCPLRVPGLQYDRYTSAVRYLDPPTLYENRPAYRLLDAYWGADSGRMRYGLGTYFDKLDISEAAGHEYAAATMARDHGSTARAPDWSELPFRSLIGDPFALARRAVIPAITTLTIRVDTSGGTPSFLLHWRDPAKVATAGGMYDVIPAGEFQPSSVAPWDRAADFDLWRNIVRELSEELLGTPEHDGSRGTPVDYQGWPLYRALGRARDDGRLYVGCLGIGLDALTLAATVLTVMVVDGETFDDLFGDVVSVNAEGVTVAAGEGHRVADGIAFTETNVRRLLTSEPLASPGAACLHLAWQHRATLLHTLRRTDWQPRPETHGSA